VKPSVREKANRRADRKVAIAFRRWRGRHDFCTNVVRAERYAVTVLIGAGLRRP
jgi:hypothetical protein